MLKQNYEFAQENRASFIVNKADLLVPVEQGYGENLYVGGMGF